MMKPGHADSNAGRTMLWLAAIGVLAGLTFMFQGVVGQRGGIVRSNNDSDYSMVVLKQDRSGHYLAEGEINGRAVTFLVDTGATDVALSERLAKAMGIEFGPQLTVMTAAGPIRAWRTRLDSVNVGGVILNNVRATITHSPMEEVLLGMSFLKHFTIRQQGDELIIERGSPAGS